MEERVVRYDQDLKVEAYRFKGIMQRFPNHFHEYYVIGFIERGKRRLSCRNKEYTVNSGDLVLFNPLDNHECEPMDNQELDYRSLNIPTSTMSAVVKEIFGTEKLPYFRDPVIVGCEQVCVLKELHQIVMDEKQADFQKEELFLILIEQLIRDYTKTKKNKADELEESTVSLICVYIEKHYAQHITLDELAAYANMNKYSMIRTFTKTKGITPYRYLQTLRISRAKQLLEQGTSPIDVALEVGFVDQSHFSFFFKEFIGLTPKQYQNIFVNEESVYG